MKKKMVDQINSLIEKNNELYNDNVFLSKQLDENKSLIEELKDKIEKLEHELENVKSNIVCVECDAEQETDVDIISVEQIEANTEQTILQQDAENNIFSGDEQPASLNSASAVIGSIVLECAKVCNEFSDFGGPNAKDLVNLALGRTEVFKSEILNIMTENEDFNSAKTEVELKVAEIKEYFDLLRKQL